jgi:hypothetical protein
MEVLPPAIPLDEKRGLSALREIALIDTPAEERFDRITRLARRLFSASGGGSVGLAPAITASGG